MEVLRTANVSLDRHVLESHSEVCDTEKKIGHCILRFTAEEVGMESDLALRPGER